MLATKAMPKEPLPVIQYAVEEAIVAGITERAIEDHFDAMPELERELRDKGKVAVAYMVHKIVPAHVNCIVIRHSKALGLANAVLCAALVIGDHVVKILLSASAALITTRARS